jgi:CubicO group peptidase (beta-lactamase class C family)
MITAASCASSAEPAVVPGDITAIDSYLTIATQVHNIPGMALAITEGDQIIYSEGYGTAGEGRRVTPDTPFYIGSQSKSFTALAILQLVERDKLDLDAPVQTYLPWFRIADPQASGQITIRHLLQHTSGLSESSYAATLPPDASLESLVRDLSRARLAAPVGTQMEYFNPGYSALGLIIETVSGQSYGEFINEYIFTPLKMENSFTDPTAASTAGLSQGHSQIFMLAVPRKQTFYQSDLPAGFIISTANDLARFLMVLGNKGELDGVRVLQPENVELMFTPNTALNNTYGLGWYISEDDGETRITHGGDTELFHTSVLLLPQKDLSLVLLFNENHLLKDFNEYDTIFWSIAAMLTGNPVPSERLSSIVYGWGLFMLWIVFLGVAVRKLFLLPQWRTKMISWNSRRRWLDIMKHLLWIAISIVIVTIIVPSFLNRGFNLRWFVAFLPDVAIVVATLLLDDVLQATLKSWMIIRQMSVL